MSAERDHRFGDSDRLTSNTLLQLLLLLQVLTEQPVAYVKLEPADEKGQENEDGDGGGYDHPEQEHVTNHLDLVAYLTLPDMMSSGSLYIGSGDVGSHGACLLLI